MPQEHDPRDSVWKKPSSPWKKKGDDDDEKEEKEEEKPPESIADDEQDEELIPVENEEEDATEGWSARRLNRSAAIQFLYAWELNRPDDLCDAIHEFFVDRELIRDHFAYTEELIHGTIENIEEIDQMVEEMAENWDFDRIAKIDLTLLRLGIHELLHRPDVPPVVVINEIIDLGKAYSEKKSKRFLNGILDQVLTQLDRPARESSL